MPVPLVTARPPLVEGDTVMLCKHIFEDARRGIDISWPKVRWEPAGKEREFAREDRSTGLCDYWVRCLDCHKQDPKSVDYIEERYVHGQLHIADFMPGGTGGKR